MSTERHSLHLPPHPLFALLTQALRDQQARIDSILTASRTATELSPKEEKPVESVWKFSLNAVDAEPLGLAGQHLIVCQIDNVSDRAQIVIDGAGKRHVIEPGHMYFYSQFTPKPAETDEPKRRDEIEESCLESLRRKIWEWPSEQG